MELGPKHVYNQSPAGLSYLSGLTEPSLWPLTPSAARELQANPAGCHHRAVFAIYPRGKS
jgi:hypothetical protein